jgi:hypothetical protein
LTHVDPKLYTKYPFEVGIHFCGCYHGGEWTTSHDAIWNALAFIEKNAKFHVLHEPTHVLPSPSIKSFHWRVNIMLSIVDISILTNVIITNPTWINLVSQVVSSCEVVIQAKEKIYHNWHWTNTFFPLAIEIFGCLHWQTNNFFHQCASMIWLTNFTNNPPLLVLHAFYRQRMLVALQKM